MNVLRHAIGYLDGDYLIIENPWARVSITYHQNWETDSKMFTVDGDVEQTESFPTASSALVYAIRQLAMYNVKEAMHP